MFKIIKVPGNKPSRHGGNLMLSQAVSKRACAAGSGENSLLRLLSYTFTHAAPPFCLVTERERSHAFTSFIS